MGAALIALFIVIDTQMIGRFRILVKLFYLSGNFSELTKLLICLVGGGRSLEISEEEYVYAAFILYLDIIRMFLYILRIVAELKK